MSYDQFYVSKDDDLLVNNHQIIDNEKHDTIVGWIHSNFYGVSICPFCNSSVIRADYFDEDADDWLYTGEYAFVVECQNCGFWQSY